MTLSDIDEKISQLTGADTSSTGYPTSLRLSDVNSWQHKVAMRILGAEDEVDFDDERRSDYPIKYIPMVAGQRDYTIPVSEKVLRFKRVDFTYDGTSYVRATPIDSSEIKGGLTIPANTVGEATLDGDFTKTSPKYDTKYNSIFAYPLADSADVARGAKILVEWDREMQEFTLAEYTAGTEVPGFDSAFHKLVALGPSYEWCLANQEFSKADRIKKLMDEDFAFLERTYGKKQLDRHMELTGSNESYK